MFSVEPLHGCTCPAPQEAGYPDINIICEKVATEGETRFEDRYRLPIGIIRQHDLLQRQVRALGCAGKTTLHALS